MGLGNQEKEGFGLLFCLQAPGLPKSFLQEQESLHGRSLWLWHVSGVPAHGECGVLGQVVGEQWCLVVLGLSHPPRRHLTSTGHAALLSQGKYGKKHPTNMESGPCGGVFLEEHKAALVKLPRSFL